jgi:hypothetical protein
VSDTGGLWTTLESTGKYVCLDLSGSTLTTIPNGAFEDLTKLTGITIPGSVASIGEVAFVLNPNLISITFIATIPSTDSHANVFFQMGDLRAVFYSTDPTDGTAGTYTTRAGGL